MRLVCSYCHEVIRHDPNSRVCDVSHGVCPACAGHLDGPWKGMPLPEHLETLPDPVVVVNGDARVIAANEKLANLFGRTRNHLRGLLVGEAFACVHSHLSRGCGRTKHCRACTLRGGVERVHETGKPLRHLAAQLHTRGGRVHLRLSVRKIKGLVKVVVEEAELAIMRAGS